MLAPPPGLRTGSGAAASDDPMVRWMCSLCASALLRGSRPGSSMYRPPDHSCTCGAQDRPSSCPRPSIPRSHQRRSAFAHCRVYGVGERDQPDLGRAARRSNGQGPCGDRSIGKHRHQTGSRGGVTAAPRVGRAALLLEQVGVGSSELVGESQHLEPVAVTHDPELELRLARASSICAGRCDPVEVRVARNAVIGAIDAL